MARVVTGLIRLNSFDLRGGHVQHRRRQPQLTDPLQDSFTSLWWNIFGNRTIPCHELSVSRLLLDLITAWQWWLARSPCDERLESCGGFLTCQKPIIICACGLISHVPALDPTHKCVGFQTCSDSGVLRGVTVMLLALSLCNYGVQRLREVMCASTTDILVAVACVLLRCTLFAVHPRANPCLVCVERGKGGRERERESLHDCKISHVHLLRFRTKVFGKVGLLPRTREVVFCVPSLWCGSHRQGKVGLVAHPLLSAIAKSSRCGPPRIWSTAFRRDNSR